MKTYLSQLLAGVPGAGDGHGGLRQLHADGVAHTVERVLPAPLPQNGHEAVERLLGSHLVVAAAGGHVTLWSHGGLKNVIKGIIEINLPYSKYLRANQITRQQKPSLRCND